MIIEDGSIVANSDSYVSRADYIAYALSFGIVITDAVAADYELVKAAQFIGSHEGKLKGYLVDRDQSMSFPRYNLFIDGFSWASNEIPRQVILCQMALAMDVNAGIDLYNPPVNPNRATSSERVEGAVDVSYFGSGASSKQSRTSTAQSLLNSLSTRSGLTIALERS